MNTIKNKPMVAIVPSAATASARCIQQIPIAMDDPLFCDRPAEVLIRYVGGASNTVDVEAGWALSSYRVFTIADQTMVK
jgi:hypothetical protein